MARRLAKRTPRARHGSRRLRQFGAHGQLPRLADWQRQLDAFMRALGVERALLVGHSLVPASSRRRRSHTPAGPAASCCSTGTRSPAAVARPSCATSSSTRTARASSGSCAGWDWALRRIIREAYAPDPVHVDRAELERWRRPLQRRRHGGRARAHGRQRHPGPAARRPRARSRPRHCGVRVARTAPCRCRAAGVPPVRCARRLTIIPGAGHLSQITHPGAVAAVIERAAG